jgi:drug/metabolite transporter (DMT)-like permease
MLNWIIFTISGIVAYIFISYFAQITGGAHPKNSFDAFMSGLHPLAVIVIVFSNLFFALAVYHGFIISRFSISMIVALGVLVTFVYSVLVLGAQVTPIKLCGVAAVLTGIALLSW